MRAFGSGRRLCGLFTSWVVASSLVFFAPSLVPEAVADPLPPSQVLLTTDKIQFAAGETFTLTAIVDQPLEDSASTLIIRDVTDSVDVKQCTSGTHCEAELGFASGGPHEYRAAVGAVESQAVTVSRSAWDIVLDVDRIEIGAGEHASLVATLNQDLSSTSGAYSVAIFDVTRARRAQTCVAGSACQVEIPAYTDDAISAQFIAAVVSADDVVSQTVVEAADIQAVSEPVTIARKAWTLQVSVERDVLAAGERTTVHLRADQNVRDTRGRYSLYIFEMSKNVLIAQCDSGTECSAGIDWVTVDPWAGHFMGVVAERRSEPPSSLGDLQDLIGLGSEQPAVAQQGWEITVESDRQQLAPGDTAQIKATANQNLGLTSDRLTLYIADMDGRTILAECNTGTTCDAQTAYYRRGDDGRHLILVEAIVAPSGAASFDELLRSGWRGDSNRLRIDRTPWQSALVHTGGSTLTLIANQNVGLSFGSWAWYLFNAQTGSRVGKCFTGKRCVFSGASRGGQYAALLAPATDPSSIDDVTYVLTASVFGSAPSPVFGPTLTSPLSGRDETAGGQNLAEGPCACGRADPVNTATGEFYLQEVDLILVGVGPSMSVARTYSTSGAGDSGPFGFGWTANLGARLRELVPSDDSNQLPRQVEVEQENGSILIFTREDSTSAFVAPDRVLAALQWDSAEAQWRLTRRDGVLRFRSDGTLVAAMDRDGNTVGFSFADGKLATINASGDRSFAIAWTGQRISKVTDSAGRTAKYSYNAAGDLAAVTAPDGAVTRYKYNSDHLITSVVRPGGGRVVNRYDDAGRVVKQKDEIDRVTRFRYEVGSDSTITTTTRPDGIRIVDRYVDRMLVETTVAEGTPTEAVTQYAYNELNLVASVLEPNGGLTSYSYDDQGNRTSQVDALGRETKWTYGEHHSPLTVTDPMGQTTTASYSSSGQLLSSTSPGGHQQVWTYGTDGTVSTFTNANGAVSSYEYDSAGRRVQVTDADGRKTTYRYNKAGLVVRTRDSAGAVSTSYDKAGRVLAVEDEIGGVTSYTYDAAGRLASETNAAGETTRYRHDAAGQLVSKADAEGSETVFAYDAAGNLSSTTDPNGNTATTVRDHYGNVVTATDPLGRVTSSTYDLAGRLLSTELPSGARTTQQRDAAGQTVAVSDALGNTTDYEYDAAGQIVGVTDPLGRTTTTTYDDDGRMVEVTLPDESKLKYTYDPAGSLLSFTNADGGRTDYGYTTAGLLGSRTEPGGLATSFHYDNAARLVRKTLPDRSRIDYTYDPASRVTGVGYSSSAASATTYQYDAAGRPVGITDATGATSLEYDETGRLVAETDGSGDELSYAYDAGGRLQSISYPDAGKVSYAYDKANQMTSLTDWSGRVTTFGWTEDGELSAQGTPNGVAEVDEYDAAGRVSTITAARGSTQLAAFSYDYDDAGQLAHQTSTFSGGESESTFSHDAVGQLSGIERATGSATTVVPATATPAGLLVVADDGSTLAYNPAQQITARHPVNGSDTTYAYDANGARTKRVAAGSLPATTTYGYDAAGYLRQVTTPDAAVSYQTDSRGLRQVRQDGTTTDQYLWSTARTLPLLMADNDNYYLYGPRSTPLAQIDKASDQASYLHTDMLGSVRLSTDGSAQVLGERTYTEFGSVLSAVGAIATVFGFTGNLTDPVTGLVHLRARDYDPETGQFVSVDPALDDTRQPYAYASNNPVQFTDPTGLYTGDPVVDGIGGGLAYFAGLYDVITFGGFSAFERWIDPGYDCFIETYKVSYDIGSGVGLFATIALGAASAGKALLSAFARDGGAAAVSAGSVATASRFRSLTHAGSGIAPYSVQRAVTAGQGGSIQAHHLIEQRFADVMGQAIGEMPSIVVTRAEHQVFTNAWREAIPYGSNGTGMATRAQVEGAARQIYSEYPEILRALGLG